MPQKRPSARPKESRPERHGVTKVTPSVQHDSTSAIAVEEVDEEYQSDFEATEDENEVFEDKEASAPKRKRARTDKIIKSDSFKKQSRPKGRLEGLMEMPSDIFTEIASYLMPKDLISLARSNKLFRKIVMNKTASHIWHSAMRNVPGIPPCPPHLSEPHYLALVLLRSRGDVDT